MADAAPKPFHICDDCLDPLAKVFIEFYARSEASQVVQFDVERAEELHKAYEEHRRAFLESRRPFTAEEQEELDGFDRQLSELFPLKVSIEFEWLRRSFRVDFVERWMKFACSFGAGSEFSSMFNEFLILFNEIDSEARQILRGEAYSGIRQQYRNTYYWHSVFFVHRLCGEFESEHGLLPVAEIPDDVMPLCCVVNKLEKLRSEGVKVAGYITDISTILRSRFTDDELLFQLKPLDDEEMDEERGPNRNGQSELPANTGISKRGELRLKWQAEAMLLRQKNPGMTKKEIAALVNRHEGQLSPTRFPAFAIVEAQIAGTPRAGFVKKDDKGQSDADAGVSDDPSKSRADAGERIPGSTYFREYCSGCGETIRVTQDQVGKSPRCEACE